MINELSIIIPTLNEEKYLPQLLNSLVEQDFTGKLQIIIADGNSIDTTIEVAKSFEKNFEHFFVLSTHPMQAHQKNVGAQHALYDYLLFIDADMVLPKNTLTKLTKRLDPDEQFVGTVLLHPLEFNLIEYIFLMPAYLFIAFTSLFDPITSGGFLYTTKENHKKVGGYLEGSILGEDIDYGKRSIKNGATYHIFWHIPVFHSSRRVEKTGLFNLILFYCKAYWYVKKHGVIYATDNFSYPYGDY